MPAPREQVREVFVRLDGQGVELMRLAGLPLVGAEVRMRRLHQYGGGRHLVAPKEWWTIRVDRLEKHGVGNATLYHATTIRAPARAAEDAPAQAEMF